MSTEGRKTEHIMVRVVVEDFDTWYAQHHGYADARQSYGLSDGPVYRDVDNPNAALVHLITDDLPRAMEWFRSPVFREGAAKAKIIGREFYVAERRP